MVWIPPKIDDVIYEQPLILLLPQKFLLFIMLKHVPHLLEDKAFMQNDGNTDDDNEDVQYIQHYKVLDKSS